MCLFFICMYVCVYRFVLSALGLYSVTPGTKGYVLGSPLFRHVRISRDPEINVYDNYYEFPLADGKLRRRTCMYVRMYVCMNVCN